MRQTSLTVKRGDNESEVIKNMLSLVNTGGYELEGTKLVGTAKVPDNREGENLLAGKSEAKRVKGSI